MSWDTLIKQMKSEIAGDDVQCLRSLRGNFDGTFKLRIAPNVKPQNFKFMLFVNLKKQKDPKSAIIDNSYGLGVSWKISKNGSVDDDFFVFNVFTEHSASKIFQLRRDRWNFLQVEVSTVNNSFTVQANDSGPLKEAINGDIRYPPKTELSLGGNKSGCFFIGEICYYGLWEI